MFVLQIFGKDTVLNMGGKETKESREQWLEDIEMKVCSMSTAHFTCTSCMLLLSKQEWLPLGQTAKAEGFCT